MARTGLTKMLADIHENVSSDDECVAHNRRIKSTTSKESKEPKEKKSGADAAEIGEVTIPRETKKSCESLVTVIEKTEHAIDHSEPISTAIGLLAEVKGVYNSMRDDTRQLNQRMETLEGL